MATWTEIQFNSSSALSCAYSGNVTSGNLLVAMAGTLNASVGTFTNSGTAGVQTWHQVGSNQNRGDGYYNAIWYAIASGTGSCTVSTNGSSSFPGMQVIEFHVSTGVISLDNTAQANAGTNVNSFTQSVNTTNAGELIVMGFLQANGSTLSFNNSFVWPSSPSSPGGNLVYLLSGSAGSQSCTMSGNNNGPASCIAVSFAPGTPVMASAGAVVCIMT